MQKTPFYGESGGQVGDTGRLEDHSRMFSIEITDTKKENGVIVHFADSLPEDIDGLFWAVVDEDKRVQTNNNHSATHLLHSALKSVLGDHVNQKGSLVNADYLRFDFSHFTKITDEELAEIEHIVNKRVRDNISLKEQRLVPYEEALSSGVTALFVRSTVTLSASLLSMTTIRRNYAVGRMCRLLVRSAISKSFLKVL